MEEYLKRREVLALPLMYVNMLKTIPPFLAKLQDGISPSDKEVAQSGDFFRKVLAKASNFCVAEQVGNIPQKSKFGQKRTLVGRLALEYKYEQAAKAEKKEGGIPLGPELKLLRQFQWMMAIEQREVVNKWVKMQTMLCRAKKALPCIGDGVAGRSDPPGSSNSRTSSSSAVAGASAAGAERFVSEALELASKKLGKAKGQEKEKTSSTQGGSKKTSAERAAMMKMFGGRVITST